MGVERRDQLLDAARACFLADGFDKTPVSAIVREAGVAQGTFYLYFKSKQEIVTELRRQVVREYERALNAIASLDAPADERLARVIVAMGLIVGRNIELERMFRASGSGEASLVAAVEGRRRMAERAAQLLAADENLVSDAPHLTAGFVVTLFDQILFDAHAFAPDTVPDVVRESLRFTLRGLGVAPERVEALVARQAEFLAHAESL